MWFSKEVVKDLFSLVGYNDSGLAAIRHVKSIIRVVRRRPNIHSYSVLFDIPFISHRTHITLGQPVVTFLTCFHEKLK